MTDRIILKGMRFFGYHGVLPVEKSNGQEFVVDAELFLPLQPAGESDNLNLTVNYAAVYQDIRALVEERRFDLIEALAEAIASRLLDVYPPVQKVVVRVKKPRVPLPGPLEYAGVEIERGRE
ncbi:MAG: dihydroneopterin aldolase [Firmicutes bacterium]|nr:dihydroneopterin aldolase [Bacillota bacterium]